MWFVAIGVLVLVMNIAGIGPVGKWAWADKWWIMLAPFGLAVAWWGWADLSGWTQRKAMARMDARREARRQKSLTTLGLQDPRHRKR